MQGCQPAVGDQGRRHHGQDAQSLEDQGGGRVLAQSGQVDAPAQESQTEQGDQELHSAFLDIGGTPEQLEVG